MPPSNTDPRAAFPITSWTCVMSARRGDEPGSRAALEELCKGYWPAIYTYLRALGCDREDALDETQEFLSRFINGGGLESLSPERGRLRSYLKQSVRHHLFSLRRGRSAAAARRSCRWMMRRPLTCRASLSARTIGLTAVGRGR